MGITEAKEKNVQPLKTQSEIDDMKYMLRRNPNTGFRDEFLFTLGIATGLRISDLIKLKVKDIRNQRTVKIKEKKTSKVRDIYLELAYEAIDEYTKGMPDDAWLFPSRKGNKPISETQAYRILVRAGENLGREDIGTHTMRKTFGYLHYQVNGDIVKLMNYFRHSSPDVTRHYIGLTEEEIEDSISLMKRVIEGVRKEEAKLKGRGKLWQR